MEVAKTCYPDKWMAEDFTNSQQIKNCRQKVHDQYMGPFETMLENERNSTQYRFVDCSKGAGNSIEKAMHCI
jgi:hypothetical protein